MDARRLKTLRLIITRWHMSPVKKMILDKLHGRIEPLEPKPQVEHRFPIGTQYWTCGKHPRLCTVIDQLTVRNAAGTVVSIRNTTQHRPLARRSTTEALWVSRSPRTSGVPTPCFRSPKRLAILS